jgi:hypothetical protein
LEAKRLLAARERELDEKAAAFDQTISDRLAAERANLSKEIEAQLRSGLSTEIADLKRQADERSERLAKAQAVELELRTEKRNLEEREKARDLEMARKLDEERVRLQLEISTRLEEEHARQVAEKDKRLSDAMKANDELRRKLQQGSQQLQGEVLELALEDLISQTFPSDLVQPVPKGINGADIMQRVQNPNGDLAGSIIWESKRTKAWSDGWIQKIKDDQRQAKADIAILVSDALPKDCNHFKQVGGIWVTHPRCAIHLASALRLLLLEVASAKRAAVAAARSSLSAPRMTILSASSGNGRCSALASSHGARIHKSRSSSLVRITGMALSTLRLRPTHQPIRGRRARRGAKVHFGCSVRPPRF